MVDRRLSTVIVGEAGADGNKSRGCNASKVSVGTHFIKEPQIWTGRVEAWEAEVWGRVANN